MLVRYFISWFYALDCRYRYLRLLFAECELEGFVRSDDAVDIFIYPGDRVIIQDSIYDLRVAKNREKGLCAHLWSISTQHVLYLLDKLNLVFSFSTKSTPEMILIRWTLSVRTASVGGT